MHSYQVMYDSGRERLRKSSAANEKIVLSFGDTEVSRSLKIITFHARDV